MAVGGAHEPQVGPDSVEPDDPVHLRSLDRSFVPSFEAECGEELDRLVEVADVDADVVHPFDRHGATLAKGGPTGIARPDRGRPYCGRPLYDSSQHSVGGGKPARSLPDWPDARPLRS